MDNEKVDLNYLNKMYLSFSVILKANDSKFNTKKFK